jgi:hypothetical protein
LLVSGGDEGGVRDGRARIRAILSFAQSGPITMSAPLSSTKLLRAEIVVERSPQRSHAFNSSTGRPFNDTLVMPSLGLEPRGCAPRSMNGSSAHASVASRFSENSPSQTVTTPMRIGSGLAAGCAAGVEHPTSVTNPTIGATSELGLLTRIPNHPDRSIAHAHIGGTLVNGDGDLFAGARVDLEIVPSILLATQTAPAPTATPIGSRPTEKARTTRPVERSILYSLFVI